jgi:hypothetical protein
MQVLIINYDFIQILLQSSSGLPNSTVFVLKNAIFIHVILQ